MNTHTMLNVHNGTDRYEHSFLFRLVFRAGLSCSFLLCRQSFWYLNGVPLEVVCDVVAYYETNKTGDNAWMVPPIVNFDCYYVNTNFSKKWLSKIPDTILTREVSNGVSRVKVNI